MADPIAELTSLLGRGLGHNARTIADALSPLNPTSEQAKAIGEAILASLRFAADNRLPFSDALVQSPQSRQLVAAVDEGSAARDERRMGAARQALASTGVTQPVGPRDTRTALEQDLAARRQSDLLDPFLGVDPELEPDFRAARTRTEVLDRDAFARQAMVDDAFDPHAPRYRQSYLREFSRMTPEALYRLQKRLAAADLIQDEFRHGWLDQSTSQALAQLLAVSNRNGLSWIQALRGLEIETAERRRVELDEARAGLQRAQTITLPDPVEVSQDLRAIFTRYLDREPTKAQLDRYTAQFLAHARTQQQMANDLDLARQERELALSVGENPAQAPAVPAETTAFNPVARAVAAIETEFADEIAVNEQVEEAQGARELAGQTATSISRLTGGL